MNNWKIKSKMSCIIVLFLFIIIINVSAEIINEIKINDKAISFIEKNIRSNYDNNIKNQVETAISLMDHYHDRYEAGELTLDQAKEFSSDMIRELRYGEDGYFWIDTVDGTNVVLYGSDVEGKNRYNLKDENGTYIVQQNIAAALSGGGYTDYYFPKEGESTPQPKRAYNAFYEPFQWIIGTGVYTNDIDIMIREKKKIQMEELKDYFILHMVILTLVFFIIIILVSNMARNITIPIEAAALYAKKIRDGDLTQTLPKKFIVRKDEIGELSRSLDKMKCVLFNNIMEMEEKNVIIKNEKDLFHTTLVSIGDGVVAMDTEGKITLVNIVALNMLNLKENEVVGKPFDLVFRIVSEETGKPIKNLVYEIFHTRQVKSIENAHLLAWGGNQIPIENSVSKIVNKDEKTMGAVVVFRDISEKRNKQKLIEYLSCHDLLTDLYNRRYFEEECEKLDSEDNYPLTLIIADLNGLKLTTDAFGHFVGDRFIQKFAEILKENVRETDILARIGGDEFGILLPKTDMNETEKLIKQIKNAITSAKIEDVTISAAFGYETKESIQYPIREVFKVADAKMYNQKLSESQAVKEEVIDAILSRILQQNAQGKGYYAAITDTCELLGERLEVNDIDALKTAAWMHDIGTITIKTSILEKKEALTEEEWDEIRHHTVAGYHILRSANKYAKISEFVLSHHENFDGSGYSQGLKGEEIPMESRIISVAVAYHAMMSDRPYRKKYSKKEAIAEIVANSGSRYDPKVVEILIGIYNEEVSKNKES